jgi:hypothetical protein
MKLAELAPNQRIVWLVVENYFNFTEDKSECLFQRMGFLYQRQSAKLDCDGRGLFPLSWHIGYLGITAADFV